METILNGNVYSMYSASKDSTLVMGETAIKITVLEIFEKQKGRSLWYKPLF